MMERWQNEKGYTLLLTLVIITLIIIFFSSFALSAMNQEKQVEKTDENYEVTAVAEMGVEYYKAKILNEMKTAEFATQQTINNTNKTNVQKNTEITTILTNLQESLTNFSTNDPQKINESGSSKDISFYLDGGNKPYFSADYSVFTIEVIGKVQDKTKSIIAKFNFPTELASFNGSNGSSSSGIENLVNLPPLPVNQCTNINDTSQCYLTSLNSLTKAALDMNKEYFIKLNSNGEFPEIPGNVKNNNFQSIIYIYGNAEAGFHQIIGTNLTLFTQSNLTISHNLNLISSTINTNGNLSISFANANAKKDFTNSFILAKSLVITPHTSDKSFLDLIGTKMCLSNEPTVSTLDLVNLDSKSKLYVLGTKPDTAKIDFVSQDEFINKCSITTGTYEAITTSVPDFLSEVIYN